MIRLFCLAAPLALAACSAREEPVANRFDRTTAEIENKARELNFVVENEVRAIERDVQNQIDALAANQAEAAMPAEVNAATPPPAANAAPGNRSRR